MSKYSSVKVHLFKHSEKSFLQALDEENIPHSPVVISHGEIMNAGIVETITALSDAMPWKSLSEVIKKWIEARENREIQMTIETDEGMRVFHAKGYSTNEIKKILPNSINMSVIQTKPDEKT